MRSSIELRNTQGTVSKQLAKWGRTGPRHGTGHRPPRPQPVERHVQFTSQASAGDYDLYGTPRGMSFPASSCRLTDAGGTFHPVVWRRRAGEDARRRPEQEEMKPLAPTINSRRMPQPCGPSPRPWWWRLQGVKALP